MKTIFATLALIFVTLWLAHMGVANWRQMGTDEKNRIDRAEALYEKIRADLAEYDKLVAAIDRDNAEFALHSPSPWERAPDGHYVASREQKLVIKRRDAKEDQLGEFFKRHPGWVAGWESHRAARSAYWEIKYQQIAAMPQADQDEAMDEMRRQFVREGKK
jgi:hypothetical protein